MAWIESHQSLLTHRKTVRAAALLKVDRHKLIGHLHALWWWALDNANDYGDLGDVTAEELADTAGWPTKRGRQFVDALITAGFIDRNSDGLSLHDWWDYAGKLNEQRQLRRDSNRKAQSSRRQRLRQQDVSADAAMTNKDSQQSTNQPTNQTNQTNQPDLSAATARPNIFRLYEQHVGTINPHIGQELLAAEEEYSEECIKHAFAEASNHNKRSWAYVKAILRSHKETGSCYDAKGELPEPESITIPGSIDFEEAEEWRQEALKQAGMS